jgi:hypothetical protein
VGMVFYFIFWGGIDQHSSSIEQCDNEGDDRIGSGDCPKQVSPGTLSQYQTPKVVIFCHVMCRFLFENSSVDRKLGFGTFGQIEPLFLFDIHVLFCFFTVVLLSMLNDYKQKRCRTFESQAQKNNAARGVFWVSGMSHRSESLSSCIHSWSDADECIKCVVFPFVCFGGRF